jgi:hypothetical protein
MVKRATKMVLVFTIAAGILVCPLCASMVLMPVGHCSHVSGDKAVCLLKSSLSGVAKESSLFHLPALALSFVVMAYALVLCLYKYRPKTKRIILYSYTPWLELFSAGILHPKTPQY